jgi:hypothetical protein
MFFLLQILKKVKWWNVIKLYANYIQCNNKFGIHVLEWQLIRAQNP